MNPSMNPSTAGWFADPDGSPQLCYFDGHRWSEHFAPLPPPYAAYPQQPPPVAVAVSVGGGVNHALHALLTFLSCGLWLPVWILCAIFGRSSRRTVAVAGPGAAVPPDRRPLIIAAVVLGCLMLGLSEQHLWVLAILIPIVGVGGLISWMRKDDEKRKRLAAHADYEDKLYYEGDPRGMYGRYMPPPAFQVRDLKPR